MALKTRCRISASSHTGRGSLAGPIVTLKLAGKGKDRYWVPDKEEPGIMAEVVRQRDASESFDWISPHIERRMCELDGRTYKNSAFFKHKWTKAKCWRAYRAWQEIQAEEQRRRASDDQDPASS